MKTDAQMQEGKIRIGIDRKSGRVGEKYSAQSMIRPAYWGGCRRRFLIHGCCERLTPTWEEFLKADPELAKIIYDSIALTRRKTRAYDTRLGLG